MLRRFIPVLLCLATTSAAAQVYPVDRSMSASEYVAHGLPSIERVWSSVDYDLAAGVLDSLRRIDIALLPRVGSPRSGEVFAHMTSSRNFTPIDSIASTEFRLKWMAMLSQSAPKILMVYASSDRAGSVLDDELADVSGFVLDLMDDMLVLLVEMLEERDALATLDDPSNDGMRQVRSGAHQTLVGVVQMRGATKQMRAPSRRRLAEYLAEHAPALSKYLTNDAKIDLRNQLDAALKKDNAEAKKILAPFVSTLPVGRKKGKGK